MSTFDADAFKATTLRDALACAVCPSVPRDDRALAAALVAHVCDHVDWTEALAADLLLTLRRCLDVPSAVEDIVDILARKLQDKQKVTGALVALGHAAHEQQAFYGLYMLAVAMLGKRVWADAVEPAWMEALASWGQGRPNAQDVVGRLLSCWIPLRGVSHDWIRRLVEEAPASLSSHWIPFTARQKLHFATPTVWGWRHFAFHQAPELQPWSVEGFGDQASKAVETLRMAIFVAHVEGESAAEAMMSGWLADMGMPRDRV